MSRYLEVTYNEEILPFTEYPFQLSRYLLSRFNIKSGEKILDVGCGRGEYLKSFNVLGLNVYGLDCERAQSQGSKDVEVKYINFENETFPFNDNMFDVVFSKSVIEHLFNPENLMKECYRVLKPGGRIILMTPDWISQMKKFYDDYSHRQPYTVIAIRDILSIFNFKKVNADLFYQLPVLWKHPGLIFLSKILRYFLPVTVSQKSKNKYIRWSIELMVLGTGIK